MKFCEKAECILTALCIFNVMIVLGIYGIDQLTTIQLLLIIIQVIAIGGVYAYTQQLSRFKKFMKTSPYSETSSTPSLNLKAHERIHEQKRHYQVALALIELGEKEKAVSYIDSIMKEMA